MKQKFFGQTDGRFRMTDDEPNYNAAFYLVAVQLVNIDGDYTDWIPTTKLSFGGYDGLLSIGKNMNEWKQIKKKLSDIYSENINYLTKGKITPIKQMVALKIRYLGEKDKEHVFHYYAPRNPY